MTSTRRARVRAPELSGAGGWLNTDGREVRLADLRGKIVLLDFWTFCCINCLHVLDELRPLEHKYSDELVVIGVHSPKFEHEREYAAVSAAVERYGITHPVLDDPDLETWQQYAAKAWPTLAVIDPEGYVVASMAGEGHAFGLDRLIAELIDEHVAKGTLHRGDGPYVPPPTPMSPLRFPGKAILLESGNLLVSDAAHHSIVELQNDGETVVRRIGSGQRGSHDGAPDTAEFNEPQGLLCVPSDVASVVGYDVLVADTVNHLLRGLRLSDGEVSTVAGTGKPWRSDVDTGELSSPWDLAWYDDTVIIAMAGIHQLWSFDPLSRTTKPYAGTTVESLRDGALDQVWMAQPSGLAADGGRLWLVDSESSALRWVENGQMHTAVGQGFFDFGHVDGPAEGALFQHPLGVCVLPDGSVAVADTYNNAIRRYDPDTRSVSTLATDVAEPSDVLVVDGDLVVVESAAHRLSRPVAPGVMREVNGVRHHSQRPASELAIGEVLLEVIYTPPPGQKLDDRYGPPIRLDVTADPPEMLAQGAGTATELSRRLVITGDGVLHVTAQAAACDVDSANPACHLSRQDWGVPVVTSSSGDTRIALILRG